MARSDKDIGRERDERGGKEGREEGEGEREESRSLLVC